MIVQACLNGGRPRGWHTALPLSPAHLAADALACVQAGAAEFHLHVRDAAGLETLAPADVDATMAALRAAVPGSAIGISTGEWIERDDDRRLACIAGWSELPDYASVNLAEAGAPAVMAALAARGVGIEAGIFGLGDLQRLLALSPAPRVLRLLIELFEQDVAQALATADAVLAAIAAAGLRRPIMLHGEDATLWPLAAHARGLMLSTRIGLEDGATLPDGTTAKDNAAMVRAALALGIGPPA